MSFLDEVKEIENLKLEEDRLKEEKKYKERQERLKLQHEEDLIELPILIEEIKSDIKKKVLDKKSLSIIVMMR